MPSIEVADRHRRYADLFGVRAAGTTDWDAQTPVAAWRARDVVAHLVDWSTAFLAAGGVRLPEPVAGVGDPAARWVEHTAAMQALLESERADEPFEHPQVPTQALAATVDAFYVADVFMHTWDLARATGQDDRLDPEVVARMHAGMSQIEEMLRASGQFGPPHEVPDDADPQDRFIAFLGRDPYWHPQAP